MDLQKRQTQILECQIGEKLAAGIKAVVRFVHTVIDPSTPLWSYPDSFGHAAMSARLAAINADVAVTDFAMRRPEMGRRGPTTGCSFRRGSWRS